MDVSFVIINYRSREFLGHCVESIFKHARSFSFEIIIVNNDVAPLTEFANLKNVHIIEQSVNRGFAQAANLGAKISVGKVLFFLNSDTEILNSNICDIIKIFNNQAAGAATPKLILSDGSPQPWGIGYDITILDVIKNNFGCVKSKKLWLQEKTITVDWASGAALAVSKEIFKKCGGFDENFFMYFEDVDLCKRIRNVGKKIIFLPHIKLLHIGGQSKLNIKEQKIQYYQSQDYYFKKHFGLLSVYIIKFLRKIALFFGK